MTAILAVLAVLAATVLLGTRGVRVRSTSDFLVASRSVSARVNAVAVAGEYLSAASFLGVAGLVLRDGIGALWYPIGFTAGYLTLLVCVAAPLRRFGAYTLPDFIEGRLGEPRLRRLAAIVTLMISGLYVVPQLIGAARVLGLVSSVPYSIAILLTAAVVCGVVIVGGMRSATYMQAFEYVVKLFCIAVPATLLVILLTSSQRHEVVVPRGTHFPHTATVVFDGATTLTFTERESIVVGTAATEGLVTFAAGTDTFPAGSRVTFSAGETVPAVLGSNPLGGVRWRRPLLDLGSGHPLFGTWSLLLATVLGTMGLPHILNRFPTNPSGRSARRTAAMTVGLVGIFYLFPPVFGLLGRTLAPQLVLTGQSDTVVVALPRIAMGSEAGILTATLAAGAFAAFLSTSSGLLLAAGTAVGHDLLPTARGALHEVRRLRYGVAAVGLAAAGIALVARNLDVGVTVGWAFAMAASTFTPLLILGIWTDLLTAFGAAAGVVTGAVLSSAAVLLSVTWAPLRGWPAVLLAEPAAWLIVITVTVMLVCSHLTRNTRRGGAEALLLMHSAD